MGVTLPIALFGFGFVCVSEVSCSLAFCGRSGFSSSGDG